VYFWAPIQQTWRISFVETALRLCALWCYCLLENKLISRPRNLITVSVRGCKHRIWWRDQVICFPRCCWTQELDVALRFGHLSACAMQSRKETEYIKGECWKLHNEVKGKVSLCLIKLQATLTSTLDESEWIESEVYERTWEMRLINLLKPSGYYMHMLEHCILPTQCVCVLHTVLTINSDCFHKRHEPLGLCSGDVTRVGINLP
jgi:hypothetical protein